MPTCFYDKAFMVKCLMGFIATMLLMKVTGGWGFVFVVPFAVYSVLRRNVVMMFFWLLLSNSMLLGNPHLMPRDLVFAVAQKVMMVLMGLSLAKEITGRRTPYVMASFLGMFIYLIYMLIPSATGWSPFVSYLKILLFTLVYMAYLATAKFALIGSVDNLPRYRAIVLALIVFFVVGSIILIPFPSIGQMSASELLLNPDRLSLFQGMTWNSQMLGPLVASFEVLLFCDLVYNIKRLDRLYIFLLLCGPFLAYKTSCRTGMAAMLSGLMFASFVLMRSRGVSMKWKSKVILWVGMSLVSCLVLAIAIPRVRTGIANFILKYGDVSTGAEVTTSEVIKSRDFLMEEALFNWKEKPILGNGFQVSATMAGVARSGILSYLTSPIEKGVWVTAVLEEGGIVGMFLFSSFWLIAIVGFIKKRAYCTASMFVFMIISNLAEFTIFSMSAEGGLIWGVSFVAIVLDGIRLKIEKDIDAQYANWF